MNDPTRLRRTLGVALALVFASVAPTTASAQSWPSKPVTLVVPFAPGGSTDVTGRMLAAKLRNEIGQTVLVENKGGAGGNLGADHAARSAPDGHTIFLATSTHATNVSLYKKLSYDFQRDLTPVSQVAFIPNLLVVNSSVPVNNLAEFLAYVRDPKNKVRYGSAGNGSSLHIAGALFNSMAGARMEHIPYKGSGPAIVDLLGGQIEAVFSPLVDVVPHVRSGRLKAIGITTKGRSAVFPEVPAITEQLPGYEVTLWNGILVPAKTPPDVVNKLNQAINTILAQPETKQLLAEQGSEPAPGTSTQFRDFIAAEIVRWRRLVEISGATVD
jgi:tripartite-type tricarboxylate transporter receptor subunit TctC